MGEENKQVAAWAELGLRKGGLERDADLSESAAASTCFSKLCLCLLICITQMV